MRRCPVCSRTFAPVRHQVYHSAACRQKAQRQRYADTLRRAREVLARAGAAEAQT